MMHARNWANVSPLVACALDATRVHSSVKPAHRYMSERRQDDRLVNIEWGVERADVARRQFLRPGHVSPLDQLDALGHDLSPSGPSRLGEYLQRLSGRCATARAGYAASLSRVADRRAVQVAARAGRYTRRSDLKGRPSWQRSSVPSAARQRLARSFVPSVARRQP